MRPPCSRPYDLGVSMPSDSRGISSCAGESFAHLPTLGVTRHAVQHGTGDKRREAGMDQFGFERLATWLAHLVSLPPGPFCVIDGPTPGRRWAATAALRELRQLAVAAGVRRRFAPHQPRHAHAVELARPGVAVLHRPAPARTHRPGNHLSIRARNRPGRDSSTPSAPANRRPSRPPPGSRSNCITLWRHRLSCAAHRPVPTGRSALASALAARSIGCGSQQRSARTATMGHS
jgi:hypothetical protein